MKNLLQINTSLFSSNGQSSKLADEFVAAWREATPGATVTVRDIGADPVPHLTAARFSAFLSQPESRTAEQQAVLDYSDVLIEEIRRADVVVLGLPLYNFGVPSSLKAYFDHVARAGVTFRYTENGPVGFWAGKTPMSSRLVAASTLAACLIPRPAMYGISCASSGWITWNSSMPKG